MMYMGIDQFGNTYHDLKHPRKDLLERIGAKHANKMYRDDVDGTARHIGYVIRGLWIRIFKVEFWYGRP